jgi:hypothetical protein
VQCTGAIHPWPFLVLQRLRSRHMSRLATTLANSSSPRLALSLRVAVPPGGENQASRLAVVGGLIDPLLAVFVEAQGARRAMEVRPESSPASTGEKHGIVCHARRNAADDFHSHPLPIRSTLQGFLGFFEVQQPVGRATRGIRLAPEPRRFNLSRHPGSRRGNGPRPRAVNAP